MLIELLLHGLYLSAITHPTCIIELIAWDSGLYFWSELCPLSSCHSCRVSKNHRRLSPLMQTSLKREGHVFSSNVNLLSNGKHGPESAKRSNSNTKAQPSPRLNLNASLWIPHFNLNAEAQPNLHLNLSASLRSPHSNSNMKLNQACVSTQTQSSTKPACQLKREPAKPAFQLKRQTQLKSTYQLKHKPASSMF